MRQTILIADGDAELGEVYGKYLRRQGYAVENATHGLDCLEKLRQTTPTALVLDVELLWGGGDGVLAWLREESTAVAVILTATAGCSSAAVEDFEPPASAFLPKPFALSALLESVRAAVATNGRGRLNIRHCDVLGPEIYIG